MTKLFKGSQKARNPFRKPAVSTLAPVIGMAVRPKNPNPQATTMILNSISVGKFLSLTDMHSNGLSLKVVRFSSNTLFIVKWLN